MDVSQFNFDHLRLTKGPDAIQHNPEEIKKGTGRTATRKLFYGVPFDAFEKQQIKELETELIERGITLPPRWSEGDTLKYLYGCQFDHEKAIKRIQECMEWRNNPASYTLTKEVLNLFETGALYIYGRDKMYRPIIVFDFGKVDFDKVKGEDFNAGITILLDILMNHCYVPGKVENIVILIDTRKLSLTKLPITPMKNWVAIGNACFPSIAFKTYVLGPPFLLRMSWKLIEGLFDKEAAAKIEILSVDELKKMQAHIDHSHLEEKHGGSLPNLTAFWPPKSTFEPTPPISRKSLRSLQEIQEMSNESPLSYMQRQPSFPSHNYYHSLPVSQGKVDEERRTPTAGYMPMREEERRTPSSRVTPREEERRTTPAYIPMREEERRTPSGRVSSRNLLESPQQGRLSKNPIFDSKPNRGSHIGNHSPMRVKERDENLINDILSSRVTPSVPNFNAGRSTVPSQMPTHNYIDSSPSYSQNTPKERVKKSALPMGDQDGAYMSPAKRQNSREVLIVEAEVEATTYLYSGGDLMKMILKEDTFLRNTDHYRIRMNSGVFEQAHVPDELTWQDQEIGGRRTAEAKLKQHVDYTHSPQNRRLTADQRGYKEERPYEFSAGYPGRQEMQKKSMPLQAHSDWQSEGPAFESSYGSHQSLQRRDREVRKSFQNDYNSEPIEEWSHRKLRELPAGYEDDNEESDEEMNFCGLCVSKRAKRKNESLRKRK